jgi:hypothetical protein
MSTTKRFPRAVLFAKAAELQSQLEMWMGETQLSIERSEDLGTGVLTDKLKDRYQQLREAWEDCKSARQALYDCP